LKVIENKLPVVQEVKESLDDDFPIPPVFKVFKHNDNKYLVNHKGYIFELVTETHDNVEHMVPGNYLGKIVDGIPVFDDKCGFQGETFSMNGKHYLTFENIVYQVKYVEEDLVMIEKKVGEVNDKGFTIDGNQYGWIEENSNPNNDCIITIDEELVKEISDTEDDILFGENDELDEPSMEMLQTEVGKLFGENEELKSENENLRKLTNMGITEKYVKELEKIYNNLKKEHTILQNELRFTLNFTSDDVKLLTRSIKNENQELKDKNKALEVENERLSEQLDLTMSEVREIQKSLTF
jgi:hypothetical protein